MITHLQDALSVGGPALWVIFGISIVLVTVGLWKFWHLIKLGAWNKKQADEGEDQRKDSVPCASQSTGHDDHNGQCRHTKRDDSN